MKLFGIALLLVAWAFVAQAEDKPDRFARAMAHVDKAKAAITAKQSQAAITALQNAIAELQIGLENYMPVLEGWKRDKPRVQSGMHVGNNGERFQWHTAVAKYTGPNGEKLSVTITSSPQMVKAQRQMIAAQGKMIDMLKQNPELDAELIEDKDWATLILASKGKRPNCNLISAHKAMVISVQARNSAAMDPVKVLFSKIDRAGLAASAGDK